MTFHLYRDDVEYGEALAAYGDHSTVTWDNLPVYHDDGVAYTYRVDEEDVASYTKAIAGDAETGFVITNTHVPGETPPAENPPETQPETPEEPPLNPEVPKTGEDYSASLLWGSLMALSALAVAVIAARRRKERR